MKKKKEDEEEEERAIRIFDLQESKDALHPRREPSLYKEAAEAKG